MIDAVVFDLDGLLVDSEPVWFRVRAEIFSRFGLAWKEEFQKALMGKNTRAWIDDGVARLGGRLGPEAYKEEVLDGMVSAYRAGGVRLMPGAREAVAFCAAGVPLGLASGSPPVLIDAALDANGWERMFRETLSSDSVPRGKPAPDSYLEVFRRLEVQPSRAVVVEDSGSGILAGKAAGAYVVAVPNPAFMPAPDVLQAADIVLDSLHHLPDHLTRSDRLRPAARP